MRAVLRDNKHVYLDTISDAESQILWEAFTFEDPNAYRTTSTARSWQGKYRKFDRINKRVVRTFLGRLAFQCRKHDLPFHVEDQRPKWKYTYIDEKLVDKDFLPGITLEDYQIAAIKKGIKCECGIFKLTTGAGKTEIIAGMCKAINCPTLILADMTVVVSQLSDRLKLREVASEIGMFFAGEKPNGEQIVIGSIQSLNPPKPPKDEPEEGSYKNEKTFKQAHKRWESSLLAYETRKRNYKMLMEYVKNAEMIIVDECDHSNSSTYKQVIRKLFNGRRRYGFSATPFDDEKPISNLNVEENFGYIIFEMQRKEIEARGRIIPLKYRMMVYEDPQFDLHNKIVLDEATNLFMVENQRFHDLILAIVQFHAGEKNMILVDRIPLGENLLESARARGMTAGFIYGKTPKRERTEFIDRFAAGDLDVLIGGKIVNRGLDVKGGVDNLIMAAGGKLRSDFLQKIGRALRVNNRGFSYVYDVLFRCNHYLYEHGKARLKTIVDAEYDSAVNFGHDTIDGPTLIKRNFRPPAKPKAGQRRIEEKTLFHQ
jgi:superfamily II DNA or RNA helicase